MAKGREGSCHYLSRNLRRGLSVRYSLALACMPVFPGGPSQVRYCKIIPGSLIEKADSRGRASTERVRRQILGALSHLGFESLWPFWLRLLLRLVRRHLLIISTTGITGLAAQGRPRASGTLLLRVSSVVAAQWQCASPTGNAAPFDRCWLSSALRLGLMVCLTLPQVHRPGPAEKRTRPQAEAARGAAHGAALPALHGPTSHAGVVLGHRDSASDSRRQVGFATRLGPSHTKEC